MVAVEPTAKTTKEQLVATTTAASTTTTTTTAQPDDQPFNDNPLGIKIKEITKPEEIRITDDKPKLFKPPARTTSLVISDASTSTAPTVVGLDHLSELNPDDIIEEEDVASGSSSGDFIDLDNIDIIEPESPTVPDHEGIDDLSSFVDGNGYNDTAHENGNKSIRQTAEPLLEADGDLSAAAASTSSSVAQYELIISDKLLEMPASSTEGGSGDDSAPMWSSTAASFVDAASTTEGCSEAPRETGQICINGKPFQLRGTDGLTRGNDDEEEAKVGRKTPNIQLDNVFATTTAASTSDENDVSASSSVSTLEASGLSDMVFDAVYYEPVTEAPIDLSGEVFETLDRTGQSDERTSSVEQKLTSHEFIDVPATGGSRPTMGPAFDGSGSSEAPSVFTEEPDVEGSTAFDTSSPVASTTTSDAAPISSSAPTDFSTDTSSVTTTSPATSDEPTSVAPVVQNETTSASGGIVNSNDDDKNREFPEQSDDYSLHSQQMQYEGGDAKSLREQTLSAQTAERSALTGDADGEHDDGAAALRVIPIARRTDEPVASTTDDELMRQPSSYADVQERSPGEPYLVPEWERNATTEATRPPKFDRRDSLILLPVNDDADFGRSASAAAAVAAAAAAAEAAAALSIVAAETSDEAADASGGGSAATYNEVAGSGAGSVGVPLAEARSIEYGFVDPLLGSSKSYFRVPGEFFRYQDKIMNS